MKLFVLVIMLSITIPGVKAQHAEMYYQKGKDCYDKDQLREALYYFKKFIALDSTKAEVYKWRGNCYLDLNKVDSAKMDYETALRKSPSMTEIYYNLSSVYAQKNQFIQAEQNLRRFIRSRPDEVDGFIRMAYLKRNENSDSSLFYFEQAYAMDSANIRVIQSLAAEYYYYKDFHKAIKFSTLARKYNAHDNEGIEILAYSNFGLGQYALAAGWADSLIRKEPESLYYYVLKYKSEIFLDTDHKTMHGAEYQPRFKDINSNAISTLDEWVEDSQHKYAYSTLATKFRNGEILGLDEYFMLYFGFTADARYSPYGMRSDKLREYQTEENYEGIVQECQELLKKDEFNPQAYEYLAVAQFRLGRMDEFAISFRKYIGFIEGIIATGTGESFNEAFVVTSPTHEYNVLGYLGMNSIQQSLVRHEGHDFDILKIKQEDNTEKEIYFNIDKPFKSLGSMFKKTGSKGGKKKKSKKG